MRARADNSVLLDRETVSLDAPFGDSFHMLEKWEMRNNDGEVRACSCTHTQPNAQRARARPHTRVSHS